jgi:hypothetical protein
LLAVWTVIPAVAVGNELGLLVGLKEADRSEIVAELREVEVERHDRPQDQLLPQHVEVWDQGIERPRQSVVVRLPRVEAEQFRQRRLTQPLLYMDQGLRRHEAITHQQQRY